MSALLLLLVGLVGAVELFHRLGVLGAFRDLAAASVRVGRVARRRGRNEYHRERAMQGVTVLLFRRSLRALALLLLVALPIAIVLLVGPSLSVDTLAALGDWQVRGILLVIMLVYAFVRYRRRARV